MGGTGSPAPERSYSEPHWERAQGAVMATEKATSTVCRLCRAQGEFMFQINRRCARELLNGHALVERGGSQTFVTLSSVRENLKLRAEVEELEHKSRRAAISAVDDDTPFELYDQRISHDVISARHFDSVKNQPCETPDLLNLKKYAD